MKRRVHVITSVLALVGLLWITGLPGCKKLTERSGDYKGSVLPFDELLSGFAPGTQLRLNVQFLDTNILEGSISTTDGVFVNAPLRRIQKLANDKLESFGFNEGGFSNYLYMAPVSSGSFIGREALVVISLFSSGRVEVRVILGANALYGVFKLERLQDPG